MRRNVLVRFLGLSLVVALGAVIATALIATYTTSDQLQGEIDANTSQLDVDGEVLAQLSNYATNHQTWAGVDRLVHELADRTGRRIALTEPDGTVITDSSRTFGATPNLPLVPAATIDARNQATAGDSGSMIAFAASETTAVIRTEQQVMTAAAPSPSPTLPGWGLTAEERREREQLAEKAAACFRLRGTTATVSTDQGNHPQIVVDSGESLNGVALMELYQPGTAASDKCVPIGLYAPSAKAKLVNDHEIQLAIACLDEAGEKYFVATENGLRTVQPKNKVKPTEEFITCTTDARAQALTPHVAPAAKLFLGSTSTFNVFSSEGMLRTAATALGVLLIAALVMIVAGRRLVRPIVELTGASQRMRNGDHAARVPVTGKDEVARLGQAFNEMAEAIQQHEFQRKAMVSDVAHELRSPLTNIKGYLVASEDGVVPLDRELITSLLEETELLECLVADLHDLALADASMLLLHPAQQDLSELVEQVVSAHRPTSETAAVSLTADVRGSAPASVDSHRIRQALGNLVSNAIRFTPPGGHVVVGLQRVNAGYNLTVTDDGSGISDEHLPHLFDRFYRADQSRSRTTGGSGLGLAITKHLVEAHHGQITVTSCSGSGSSFTIWLPGD